MQKGKEEVKLSLPVAVNLDNPTESEKKKKLVELKSDFSNCKIEGLHTKIMCIFKYFQQTIRKYYLNFFIYNSINLFNKIYELFLYSDNSKKHC